MCFAENLAYFREKERLSCKQLAEILQVPEQLVTEWESGTALPNVEQLLKISTVFNISVDSLLKSSGFEQNNNHLQNKDLPFIWSSLFLTVLWLGGLVLLCIYLCKGIFAEGFPIYLSLVLLIFVPIIFFINVLLAKRKKR